jgi:hypothetical protein
VPGFFPRATRDCEWPSLFFGGGALAWLFLCLAAGGCLSDLEEPARPDAGDFGGPDGAGGRGDGGVPGTCDPAGPFHPPEPLQTAGGSINDGVEQAWPRVSRDDLTLYYVEADTRVGAGLIEGAVRRVGRAGDDVAAAFDMGTVASEEAFVAGDNNEAPFLSADGRRLFYNNASAKTFASDRGGTEGPFPYPGDELGINETASRDLNPYLVGDVLYFASSRRNKDGTLELYRSMAQDGGLFEVAEPMDIATDPPRMQFAPAVSSDERVIFFSADGAIYRAVRRPEGTFDTATAVEELNDGFSFPGSLSPDDCLLYFHSDRRTGADYDIFVARAQIMF